MRAPVDPVRERTRHRERHTDEQDADKDRGTDAEVTEREILEHRVEDDREAERHDNLLECLHQQLLASVVQDQPLDEWILPRLRVADAQPDAEDERDRRLDDEAKLTASARGVLDAFPEAEICERHGSLTLQTSCQ